MLFEKKENPLVEGISSSYNFAKRNSSASIDFTTPSYFGLKPFSPAAFKALEARFRALDKLASNAKNTAFEALGKRSEIFLASLFESFFKSMIVFKVPNSDMRPIASDIFLLSRVRKRITPH